MGARPAATMPGRWPSLARSAPLEEARALDGIGHSHLRDGHPGEAAASLEQALAIYQRIGSPDVRRVQETLHQVRQGNLPPAPER